MPDIKKTSCFGEEKMNPAWLTGRVKKAASGKKASFTKWKSLIQEKREVHDVWQGRYKLDIKCVKRELEVIEIKWPESALEVNLARDLKVDLCDIGKKGGLSPIYPRKGNVAFWKRKPCLINLQEFFERKEVDTKGKHT